MRSILLILVFFATATGLWGEFIEPDADFFHAFWKTLPVEEELPFEPPHSREKPEARMPSEAFEPPLCAVPRLSLLFWGDVALAVIMGLLAVAEFLALSREQFFCLRLKSALGRGDYPKVLGLLRHHFHTPPGTSLTQLADNLADARLAGQIRALAAAEFAPSNQFRKL